jgi:hypothetical protein
MPCRGGWGRLVVTYESGSDRDDPVAGPFHVQAIDCVSATPFVRAFPDELDLDSAETLSGTVVINNAGSMGTLTGFTCSGDCDMFGLADKYCSGATLATGAACSMEVVFVTDTGCADAPLDYKATYSFNTTDGTNRGDTSFVVHGTIGQCF